MARQVQKLQLTLALLKPDVMVRPHDVKEIRKLILKNNFLFVRSKVLSLSRSQAEAFYAEHKDNGATFMIHDIHYIVIGRFFYNRLVNFMSSGPVGAHVLAGEDAINSWRHLMGPTKVFRTMYSEPTSVRGRYGLTDTRNSTHGSDCDKSARKEIGFFFEEFQYDNWFEIEELQFREGRVDFDPDDWLHLIHEDNSSP